MTKNRLTLLFALALCACGSTATAPESAATAEHHAEGEHGAGEHHAGEHHAGEHHAEAGGHEQEAPPEPTRVLEDGSRLFGAEVSEELAVTPLADIMAAPDQFEGQVVKTEGEISQVCQAMGCWMELRADAESPGIRVPMANHAFFLPRDVAGSQATIEGTVRVEPLSEEERAHLESEGATATTQDVSIDATGVIVR